MKEIVGRIRARLPGVRIIGATVTSALGSTNAAHGSPEEDEKRKHLNEFIRTSNCSTAWPISTRSHSTRKRVNCGPSSCRRAQRAARATSSIPIGRVIRQWGWP